MRKPKYLSPTAIDKWNKDRQEFYLSYLADNRPPRIAQSRPMAAGGAFDAYVKGYLIEKLMGVSGGSSVETLLSDQIESHNLEWATKIGGYIFDCYRRSGALADLMVEMSLATGSPRFESTVEAIIDGVPLLGKPDLWFEVDDGPVVIDWKVNGFCGKSATSPKPGFIKVRDCWDSKTTPNMRNHMTSHPKCQEHVVSGLTVNIAGYFESVYPAWAVQLAVYSWLLGAPVGAKTIIGIDQIVSRGGGSADDVVHPLLRVASHRARLSSEYQETLHASIVHIWNRISRGPRHIFDGDPGESEARCTVLDSYHAGIAGDTPEDEWFASACRGESRAW